MATQHDDFERTVMPQSRSLLRVARRMCADLAEAEDLVQETMLLAWRNFHQFRQGTNARAWLFQILFNSFYARGRRRQAETTVDSPDAIAVTVDFSIVDSMDISRALKALPEEQRAALMLGVVEGFTCREISDILSLPIGTVMSRLSRGRRALRTQLAPSAKYNEKEHS